MSDTQTFLAARDCLMRTGSTPSPAQGFRWPRLEHFNWALDYFDVMAKDNHSAALLVARNAGTGAAISFLELARRSGQVANWLVSLGVDRGDRILMMTDTVPALWEVLLAAIKIGAVLVPTSPLLTKDEIEDRLSRGRIAAIVTQGRFTPLFEGNRVDMLSIEIGGGKEGWIAYDDSHHAPEVFTPAAVTRADEPLLLYFTSGTTASPKLVEHTHSSYPVGHLSTMYWLGCRAGDIHLNLSSPGWAKHAWSSFFGPWNAGATILTYQYERFDAKALLSLLARERVTTFCAPPTVWRAMVQCELREFPLVLREAVSAGEPLNPEIIDRIRAGCGVTVRDGFGQTESTAMIGNPPGSDVAPGSMGRSLPGFRISLRNDTGEEVDEGEICVDLADNPVGLMRGYADRPEVMSAAHRQGFFRTGDIAKRDESGRYFYVGRADDLFKCSDYRISPFELESVLIGHPGVMEAAVVPAPDPKRLAVPKAVVTLSVGYAPDERTASSILAYVRTRVAPFKRIRRIEFAPLPKTMSGKIRRNELRRREIARAEAGIAVAAEFREDETKASS